MADARHDSNQVETMIGTSSADGTALVRLEATAATHVLDIMDGTTGSDFGGNPAKRDNNGVPAMLAVSSADGVTPVAIYADPTTGDLLVDST